MNEKFGRKAGPERLPQVANGNESGESKAKPSVAAPPDRTMLDQAWERVREKLRQDLSESAFASWIAGLSIGEFRDGRLKLQAPSRFVRDWVKGHYTDRLLRHWQAELTQVGSLEFVVEPPPAPSRRGPIIASAPGVIGEPAVAPTGLPRQGPGVGRGFAEHLHDDLLPSPDPRYSFQGFVEGDSNRFALAAARQVAEADRPSFNPLYLVGGVGLGKTHLMQAIWHVVRERNPERRVVYLTAETFLNKFVLAVRNKTQPAFKEIFRGIDLLMIDDLQYIFGKPSTQEEFLYTFNTLLDQSRQVVLSSERPPSEFAEIDERLKSRLNSGLVAEIQPTTADLRLRILQARTAQAGVAVPEVVLEFLAQKIANNVRELEGALNRVVAHATLVRRELTLEAAQEVLHDVLRAADRKVTVEEIQSAVCQYYGLKPAEMGSPRRSRSVARPRQVAMFLAKALTPLSLPQIGKKFGGRDHTTVMHAVRKITQLRGVDQKIAHDVDELLRRLQG
jgi:chromosomal replication initiator protein